MAVPVNPNVRGPLSERELLRIKTKGRVALVLTMSVIGFGIAGCAARDCQEPAAMDVFALVHGSVVTMSGDDVLRDGAVLIEDGRIVALGPTGSLDIPPGAKVRDLNGSYVIPGLIDSHVHLREPTPSLALFPSYGVTTMVNLEGEDAHLDLRDSVLTHGLFAARILSSGPFIDRIVNSAAEARDEVRRQHELGYDLIKIHGEMDERAFLATIDEAKRLNLPVIGHHPNNLETAMVLEGLAALAHVEELLGSSLLDEPTDLTSDEVDAIARTVADSGTGLITTLGFFTGMRDQATDRFYHMIGQPELAYVSPERRREWLYNGHREYIDRSELPWYETAVSILHRITGAIHEHGGVIIAGTDSPLEFTIPGKSLHRELHHLVSAGLTPLEALRAATVAPADLLGAAELGRIEIGAAADLVVLGQDPTQSLAALDELEAVILRGRWIPRAELDRRRDEVAATYARDEVVRSARERIHQTILDLLHTEGIKTASSEALRISEISGVPQLTERDFNTIGYKLLDDSQISAAIEVFRLNARLHPGSANVYDSLGEAYLAADRFDEAEANYRRVLELDPTMDSARRGLRMIENRRGNADASE